MKLYSKPFHLTLMAAACIGLSGCESMNDSMAGIKTGFGKVVTASSNAINSLKKDEKQEAVNEEIVAEAILAADEGCPDATVVNDLSALHRFVDMSSPSEKSSISNVTITDIANGCRYKDDNIVVEMNIRFQGEAGERARIRDTDKPSFSYPYFVAVTSPHGTILSKEVYALTMSYDEDENEIVHTEQIRQIIPLDGDIYGPDHSILVGFQLTEQELAYNRKMIREDADKAFAMSLPAHVVDPSAIEPAAGDETVEDPVDLMD